MVLVMTSTLWHTMAAGNSSGTMHTVRSTHMRAGRQVSSTE